MTTKLRSKAKGVIKRGVNLDNDLQKVPDPFAGVNRTQLISFIAALQTKNAALHQELSVQHEKANQALRILGGVYNFMIGINYAYINTLQNFKDAGNEKPLPAFWLAARICDTFEALFDKFDIEALDIGPGPELLKTVYKIANRPLNPGSKIGTYCQIPLPEETPPETPKEIPDVEYKDNYA